MITWSRYTYRSHEGNRLGQVAFPWTPFVLYIGKSWPSHNPNMVHLKSNVMKITYYIWDKHLTIFETSILLEERTKWFQWIFTQMGTWSRNTYGFHGGSPLGQVTSPWAPFFFQIGNTWPSYGPNMVHLKSDIMKITSALPCLKPAFCHLAFLWSKHGPLEIWCHGINLLYTGPAPCHV